MNLWRESMEVVFENNAVKQYERLNEPDLTRITNAIDKLENEPPQGDIKKLTDREDYRLRVGGYRVLYHIENETIIVSKIDQRGQAYKGGKHQ